MTDGKKCAHPGCRCKATMDSDFCSAYCMSSAAANEKSQHCECGHAECDASLQHAQQEKNQR
jgi:hypothetical protein